MLSDQSKALLTVVCIHSNYSRQKIPEPAGDFMARSVPKKVNNSLQPHKSQLKQKEAKSILQEASCKTDIALFPQALPLCDEKSSEDGNMTEIKRR